MEFRVNLDENLYKSFEMALQLNNENEDTVINALVKSYVSHTFSKVAASYGAAPSAASSQIFDNNYGKAAHKIPLWAKKQSQICHKIIRAYFQLEEKGVVTYDMLAKRCNSAEEHPDVYVATFSSNFAQMKFDGDKSYGKVFDVSEDGIVTIWEHIKNNLSVYKKSFTTHSTDIGYVNDNHQRNMGKTDMKGSDHGQYLYEMKCELCGHEYYANGSDIFLKKCPKCQGGADTRDI